MAGVDENELQARADAFARTFVPAHLLPEMQWLLAESARRRTTAVDCERLVPVDVLAAAKVLELPLTQVLGISVAVEDGRLTSHLTPPVTYKAGKVDAIQQRIQQRPALVSGDSSGDVEMMQFASQGLLIGIRERRIRRSHSSPNSMDGWCIQRRPSTDLPADLPTPPITLERWPPLALPICRKRTGRQHEPWSRSPGRVDAEAVVVAKSTTVYRAANPRTQQQEICGMVTARASLRRFRKGTRGQVRLAVKPEAAEEAVKAALREQGPDAGHSRVARRR